MNIGRLRFLAELQDFTTTKSVLNQQIKTGRPVIGTYWCDLSSLSGRELLAAQQQNATVSHKITMRWVGLVIKPTHRLVINGRVFQIVWTDNVDNRNRELRIYCLEKIEG